MRESDTKKPEQPVFRHWNFGPRLSRREQGLRRNRLVVDERQIVDKATGQTIVVREVLE